MQAQSDKRIEDVSDLTSHDIALALLEGAWGIRIQSYDDDYTKRMEYLIKNFTDGENELLIVVSNSNEMDIVRFLYYAHKQFPDYFDTLETIDCAPVAPEDNVTSEQRLIKVGEVDERPILVAVSYRFQVFKTDEQTQQLKDKLDSIPTTAGLLRTLVKDLKLEPKDITLFSHWRGDLKMGEKLRIPREQICLADKHLPAITRYNSRYTWAGATVGFASTLAVGINPTLLIVLGLAGWITNEYLYDFGVNVRSSLWGFTAGAVTGLSAEVAVVSLFNNSALPTSPESQDDQHTIPGSTI